MQIETYELEELKGSEATDMAADSEAIELIEKLGLEGQQKLTVKETATRFPYPRLSASQAAVFGTMFPQKTYASQYSQGIIPLRVLQVISFCRQFPQTAHLNIWHAASVKEDPILVGSPGPYSSEEYLLARWGDALPTFEELQAKALPLVVARFKVDLAKAKQKLDGFIASAEDLATVYLSDGNRPTWSIYE